MKILNKKLLICFVSLLIEHVSGCNKLSIIPFNVNLYIYLSLHSQILNRNTSHKIALFFALFNGTSRRVEVLLKYLNKFTLVSQYTLRFNNETRNCHSHFWRVQKTQPNRTIHASSDHPTHKMSAYGSLISKPSSSFNYTQEYNIIRHFPIVNGCDPETVDKIITKKKEKKRNIIWI